MLPILNLKRLLIRNLNFSQIPESPGVYLFLKDNLPCYIGKAINLKARLRSYFSLNLAPKTQRMVKEAEFLSFIKVNSDLESLLLEASLIQKYQPKYNSVSKDDKHPLYIRVTKETYPKVITARKIEANQKNLAFFGPFPSSRAVRSVLRMLRKIFPYAEHKVGVRPCLYSHLGLCHPCPSSIERTKDEKTQERLRKIYKNNIKHLNGVLSGKFKSVRNELVKEMLAKSREEKFEEAQGVKKQIERLDYITQSAVPTESFLENPNLTEDIRRGEMAELKAILKKYLSLKGRLLRIECFDVSHLAGASPTASMVTFINAEPDKNFYRHFRVRQDKGADDLASMREVIKRRSKYLATWGIPNLIVVDGGKTQVSAFLTVLKDFKIPIVGIAKTEETLVIPLREKSKIRFFEKRLPRGGALNLIQRLRNESHRFARKYHHHLLRKTLLPLS